MTRARRGTLHPTVDGSLPSEPVEEETESDDEMEEDDDEFDIDDSSTSVDDLNSVQNATVHVQNEQSAAEFAATKAREVADQTNTNLEVAAAALTRGLTPRFARSSRSRSRSKSGLRSGVDTPGRFARPTHLPPHLPDHHHSASTSGPPSPTISNSSDDSLSNMDRVQRGARDDIHMEQQDFSGHSRIPRDRDFDDNLHTPTIPDHPSDRRSHSRPRGGPREDDHQHRRAFAVWGNDETDSGTSDSDP